MRRFLTRYALRYPRTLIYMLQASEYNTREFFAWYARVGDFRYVEKRKTIDWTLKARALSWVAWGFFALAAFIIVLGFMSRDDIPHAVAAFLLVAAPLALPYVLSAAVQLGAFVQRPMEHRLIEDARRKLRAHPALKIAIAGSYGKTSMREIIKTVLSAGKKVAAPPGSYNTPLGIASFVRSLGRDEEVIVFELGEYYPGDVKALCDIVEPDIGIITGVNEAHLEKFGSLEATASTIFELADHLGEKPLYVNGENEAARTHAPAHAIVYSRDGVDEWRVENARCDLTGTRFTLRDGGISIAASSQILGSHMIGSLAAAAHLARSLGLTVAQIEDGMSQTRPFAHRMEPKDDGSGVITLDDSYNGNPDGVRAVIEFLSLLPGRRFYVTPGLVEMGARTEEVHKEIGRQLTRAKIDHVVLIRNSVTPFIESGLRESGFSGVLSWYDDGPSAYAALPHVTAAGDTVLLQNDWPDQYA